MTVKQDKTIRIDRKELHNNFMTGYEKNDRIIYQNKRDVIKSIIAQKAAYVIKKDPKVFAKLESVGMKSKKVSPMIIQSVENSVYSVRSKLITNFKVLNQGGVSSVEYKIPPHEIMTELKENEMKNDKEQKELMRKKFLQEKIEVYYRLINELREMKVIEKIIELKGNILRDAIDFRFKRLKAVDEHMAHLKKSGVMEAYLAKPVGEQQDEKTTTKRSTVKGRRRASVDEVWL